VLCFLHGFLKIRDRCRKARDLHTRVWEGGFPKRLTLQSPQRLVPVRVVAAVA